jgi:hypothetical protein
MLDPPDGKQTNMSVLTIRLADVSHARLRTLAWHLGICLNKLFEEFAARAVTEFDTELRYRMRAVRGDAAAGLALPGKLDDASGDRSYRSLSKSPHGAGYRTSFPPILPVHAGVFRGAIYGRSKHGHLPTACVAGGEFCRNAEMRCTPCAFRFAIRVNGPLVFRVLPLDLDDLNRA